MIAWGILIDFLFVTLPTIFLFRFLKKNQSPALKLNQKWMNCIYIDVYCSLRIFVGFKFVATPLFKSLSPIEPTTEIETFS